MLTEEYLMTFVPERFLCDERYRSGHIHILAPAEGTQILGLQYGDKASLVYGYYSGLKIVDVMYGISSIVVGILMVYARFGLKKFKAGSVGVYLFLPLVNAIAAILYLVVASIVLHTSLFDSNLVSGGTIGLIIGSIVLFIANYIYFGRRKHLFNEA